jgi:hypothetical protein
METISAQGKWKILRGTDQEVVDMLDDLSPVHPIIAMGSDNGEIVVLICIIDSQ